MTATAEAPNWEAEVAELRKQGASIAEAVGEIKKSHEGISKRLDAPDFSGLRASNDSISYWEPTDEKVKLRLGKSHHYPIMPKMLPSGYKPFGEFKSFGHFLQDGYRNHKQPAFEERMTKAIQGLSESVASEGGFFVMPEFSTRLFERVYSNDLFGRLTGFTVGGNNMTFLRSAETSRATGSRAGGVQGYWTGEGDTITKSKPKVKDLTLRLKKVAIVVYLTNEVRDDATTLEQFVTKACSDEFDFMLGDAVVRGNGVGQPLGMLNAGALISIAKETGQAAATIVTENIDKMWQRRFAGGNYVWLLNQDTHAQIQQLSQAVGTGGALLYRPPGGLSSAPYATLKGAPVIETEFNSTLGAQGDIILCDLSQIVSISKGGIAQAESMHVEFLTDQTALRFTMRVDFRPWEDTPITPYQGSSTQSSFVTLDVRA